MWLSYAVGVVALVKLAPPFVIIGDLNFLLDFVNHYPMIMKKPFFSVCNRSKEQDKRLDNINKSEHFGNSQDYIF